MKNTIILFISLLAIASCEKMPEKPFIEISGIDNSIKPGDNFFRYVNAKWYDTVSIPNTQAGVGAYMFMNYPQRLRLQGILDSVSQSQNPEGSIAQKVGDFYASGMDTSTINKRNYEPINPILSKIEAISDVPALMDFVAHATKTGNSSILEFYVGPDNKNSRMNIAHVHQTGIGLPDRDYYFRTDSATIAIQEAYKTYLIKLFQLIGNNAKDAKMDADLVYDIEKQLAEVHKTRVELRDVKANYHKTAVTYLNTKHPNIGWWNLIRNLGVQADSIDVRQPLYYNRLNELLKTVSINDWKVHLAANTLTNYDDYLSEPFVDASFQFTKVLSGQSTQKTRGEKMASTVDHLLGEALGQLYVKKYFSEEAKARMLVLVNNVQKAYAARIDKLAWMSDSTKQKAKEKLFAITKKI